MRVLWYLLHKRHFFINLFLVRINGYHDGMTINLVLGILAIVYGVYSFVRRKTAPENIEKLQTMIERNGEQMAHTIHLVGYTILPIIAGLLLLLAAFRE